MFIHIYLCCIAQCKVRSCDGTNPRPRSPKKCLKKINNSPQGGSETGLVKRLIHGNRIINNISFL